MHYLGGKFRIRKQVCEVLNEFRKPDQLFVDLFCGGLSITQDMSNPRLANDICIPLIVMFKALQKGWIPPDTINEDTYQMIKKRMDYTDPLTAFVGFGCSFGGKWFGGYARDPSSNRNYAENMKNSCLDLKNKTKDVEFRCLSYTNLVLERVFKDCLIYCDPPYANSTGYMYSFNSQLFWWIVRYLSKDNIVIVSEYKAPDDFYCIKEISRKTGFRKSYSSINISSIDKLFIHEKGMLC